MLPQLRDPLIKRLDIEPDAEARGDIIRQLAAHANDDEVALDALIRFAAQDGSWASRYDAFRVAVAVIQAHEDRLHELLAAAIAISKESSETVLPDRMERFNRGRTQYAALTFLIDYARPAAGPVADVIFRNVTESDADLRARIHQWLAEASVHPAVRERLLEHLDASDVATRRAAANIMGQAAELAKQHGEDAWDGSTTVAPALVLIGDPAEQRQAHDLLDSLQKALANLAERIRDERIQNHIYNELIPLVEQVKGAINAEAAASPRDLDARRWRTMFKVTTLVSLAKGLALGVTALGGLDEAAENVTAAADGAEQVGRLIGETALKFLQD